MALRFISLALSRIALISATCWATGRPGLEGQSMLATVATQAARNSRGGGGGGGGTRGGGRGGGGGGGREAESGCFWRQGQQPVRRRSSAREGVSRMGRNVNCPWSIVNCAFVLGPLSVVRCCRMRA